MYDKALKILHRYPQAKTVAEFPQTMETLEYRSAYGCKFAFAELAASVRNLYDDCISNCSNLETITMHEGVQVIQSRTFSENPKLKTVNLPSTVTKIGDGLVDQCPLVETLTVAPGGAFCSENNVIYNSQKTICYAAAKTLTEVSLPMTLQMVRPRAFSACRSLAAVSFPDATTNIGSYSFQYCSGLKEIKFGRRLKTLTGGWTFNGCSSLTSVAFPDSLTTVGQDEFSSCWKLEKISFGSQMQKIQPSAFYGDAAIKEILIRTAVPPTLGNNAFSAAVFTNAKVSVPAGTLDAYKAATNWSKFQSWEELSAVENAVEVAYTGSPRIVLEAGAVIPVLIKNTGSNEVNSIVYTVSIDGQQQEYSFDDIAIPAYESLPYSFPANILPVGKHTIVINITKVNGQDNNAETKDLTISIEILTGVDLPADAPQATVTNFEVQGFYGNANKKHFDVAHLFADPNLTGKKVLGMKVIGLEKTGLSNVKLWYSTTATLSGNDVVINGETANAMLEDGVARAAFVNPVELTNNGIYFGITLDNDQTGSAFPFSMMGSDMSVNKGFLFHAEGTSYYADYSADGVLPVILYLEEGASAEGKLLISSIDDVAAAYKGTEASFPITYRNYSGTAVNSVDYSMTYNGSNHTGTVTLPEATSIYLSQPHKIALPLDVVENAGSYPATVSLTKANGTANPSAATTNFTYYVGSFNTTHRPIMEEYTGTGCPWCPRGTLAMNELGKTYPDFISAAYHGYNSDDPMYIKTLPLSFRSAPGAFLDRKGGQVDPYYGSGNSQLSIKKDYEARRAVFAPADLGIEATLNADSTITVKGSMCFSYVDNGYSLCYLLTIDGLKHTEAAWNQKSAFSGSDSDPLLNSLCNRTYDINTFNHVVIDCTKASNSNHWAKDNLQVGKTYSASNTFNLNNCSLEDKSWLKNEDWSKINVIAFVRDDNGGIGNAIKVRLGEKTETPTGIENALSDSDNGQAEYYDLMGRRVQQPQHGIFIKVQGHKATKVAL